MQIFAVSIKALTVCHVAWYSNRKYLINAIYVANLNRCCVVTINELNHNVNL